MAAKRGVVIGAGFAGLAAATSLAQRGYDVSVVEKNKTAGGRARKFSEAGFTFDMGPSWYWMPDVFENYFQKFGKHSADYYDLKRLDPSYRVIYGNNLSVDVPSEMDALRALFERIEKGSGERLDTFLSQAAYKYKIGMQKLVYRPSHSITEFANIQLFFDILRLNVFQSMHDHVRKFFRDEKIIRLMEFPVLFLGATPQKTPALYSLMNYADMVLGTWYPRGGMHKIIEGMMSLAREKGVKFYFDDPVIKLNVKQNQIGEVITTSQSYKADFVVGSADYHHIDSELLNNRHRNYSKQYWENRVMSPSSLIFYLGVNKKIKNLLHHNLFFDEDFARHAKEIYETKKWPENPLFYACVPSKTDDSVAPEGMENIFLLMPVASGLEDTPEKRAKYFDLILRRLEKYTGETIREHITFKRSYAHKDFERDYNAFKGNAYGLANTLMQTAFLKPKMRSKKIKNLFYSGQITVPGPGVPPSLISGQIVAEEISKILN